MLVSPRVDKKSGNALTTMIPRKETHTRLHTHMPTRYYHPFKNHLHFLDACCEVLVTIEIKLPFQYAGVHPCYFKLKCKAI